MKNPAAAVYFYNMQTVAGNNGNILRRFWQYQGERFPVFRHGVLIMAFTFSAASYSRMLRGAPGSAPLYVYLAGGATAIMLFLLLRFFDEFKDAAEDAAFRPYRPVPRGLVSLREIGGGIAVAMLLSLALNLLAMPRMVWALAVAFAYILVMWREFFISGWLRRHPVAYLVTHMMVMPVIDFYTTGLDWINAGAPMPPGLFMFLLLTFLNGCVIEIGRKIRSPRDEERGVETYSFLWGGRTAAAVWLSILSITLVLAFLCCRGGGYGLAALPFLLAVFAGCAFPAVRYRRRLEGGRHIETAAGIWTIAMYLIVGGAPMAINWLKQL